MGKFVLPLFFVLSSLGLFAQTDLHSKYEANAHLYPLVIPYPDEQAALSFSESKSGFCLDLTKDFSAKASSRKELSTKNVSHSSKPYALSLPLTLPPRWLPREKIIAFSPQAFSCTLLVNGKQVAFIEKDIPLQYNISSLLQPTDNLIELQLTEPYQPGSLNTVLLVSQPPVHIVDFHIYQAFKPMPQKEIAWSEGFLLKNYSIDQFKHTHTTVSKFYDQSGKLVKTIESDSDSTNKPLQRGGFLNFGTGYSLGSFKTWNAESPFLYHYTHQISTTDKQIVEVLSRKVGFRVLAWKNKELSLGNIPARRPVHFKPVHYRLPALPDSSHSRERLTSLLQALKQHHVNTLIVPLYPIHSLLYELCDELGLYVIHQIESPPLKNLKKMTAEQQANQLVKQMAKLKGAIFHIKPHPSTTALFFNNYYDSTAYAKALAETVYSVDIDIIVAFKDRILFKGNQFYQSLPLDWYKIPEWEKLGSEGRQELKKRYQPVDFRVSDSYANKLNLTNGYDFVSLDNMLLQWQIKEGGRVIEQGQISELSALPKKSAELLLPFNFADYKDKKEVVFNFSLSLKESTRWAEKGHEIASQQFGFITSNQQQVLINIESIKSN